MNSLKDLELELKNRIISVIKDQGFKINPHLRPMADQKEIYKKIQVKSKKEQLKAHQEFILRYKGIIKHYLRNGSQIKPCDISLELREVVPDSLEEIIFKWWNLNWWSIPYQRPYGRQMRFVLWDRHHNTPFGLIGLQSPVLKMSVRDKALKIPKEELDYWVNHSMHAQRLGALPPYNSLIGGKMVALAVTCNELRQKYRDKYIDRESILQKRILDPNLFFITTTSAFGKSSIYNRLNYCKQKVAISLGYTKGFGTFHIPEDLYIEIIKYLEIKGIEAARSFGSGPSRRIKLLSMAFRHLEIPNFTYHNLKREFFLFPLIENLIDVIAKKEEPIYYNRSFKDLELYWKNRWAIPRSERDNSWRTFDTEEFFRNLESEWWDEIGNK